MATRLVRFAPCMDADVPDWDEKWEFTFDNEQTVILRETWDEVLIGQPLEAVERWLVATYGWALDYFGVRVG